MSFENTLINLNHIRDLAIDEYTEFIQKLGPGEKLLIFDESLSKPFSLLEIPETFNKANNIIKTEILSNGPFSLPDKISHVVYIVRPQLSLMKWIAIQVKYWRKTVSTQLQPSYHIFMSPRLALQCEKLLEELEVDIKVQEFHLDLIPFDNDVLSMEISTWKDYYLQGDISPLYYVAKSLMKIQSLYGAIPNIKAKGTGSCTVLDIMQRLKKQTNILDGQSEIDTCILIDRNVDLYTPLLIQLTYEGLIDELFGIESKSKGRLLNSSDRIFSEIRDYNQVYIGQKLRNLAALNEKEMDERKNLSKDSSVQQIKDFTKKVNRIKEDRRNLEFHINLLQEMTLIIGRKSFKKAVSTQQSMLLGDDVQGCVDYIEESINKQDPITKVLRLLCLMSLTIGLSSKQYEFFKREIIQSYGYEHLLTILNLEKVGLLSNKSPSWSKIKSSFDLVHEDMDMKTTQNDMHSIFSGYSPLSVKLIDLAISKGWKGNKSLDYLPGPTREETIPIKVDATPGSSRKVVLIYFVGGVTFSELNAIRLLSKKYAGSQEFLVASTGIISGDKLLECLYEKFVPPIEIESKDDEFVKIDKKEIPSKYK